MNSTLTRDGHTLDILEHGDLRIMVSRKGAELVSLARKNSAGEWTGFVVRDGDVSKNPNGWSNHSTVMGYYIHRLLGEKSSYRGHEIRGGTHSFLRHRDFSSPEVTGSGLIHRFHGRDLVDGEYPFEVDFTIRYDLFDERLHVTFYFENHENFETHVSFGLHPGFAVSDLSAMRVLLPSGQYQRHLAPGNFLSGEIAIVDFPGGPMPFAVSELPDSFLLDLADVPERIFHLEDPPSGRRVTLDYSEAPYLTLWSDLNPTNPFICIEPCWGLPDHHEQRPFEEKLGLQIIPAHGTLQRRFTMLPEFFNSPV